MRRWLTAMALGGVAALTLAGCGMPAGVDGALTDEWATLSAPTPFVPAVGACHPRVTDAAYASAYAPVDCAERHEAETVHVASFTGDDANRVSQPPLGSPALRAARAECERKANALLGRDWHSGRLGLRVVLPPAAAWPAGARWFRCDLYETDSLTNSKPVSRTGRFARALTSGSALAHGCFDAKMVDDRFHYLAPLACTAPHNAEFAGVYTAPDVTWQAFIPDSDGIHRRCRTVIAAFVKAPADYEPGSIYDPPTQRDWESGDRTVRCFLWIDDGPVRRSMKGGGPALR